MGRLVGNSLWSHGWCTAPLECQWMCWELKIAIQCWKKCSHNMHWCIFPWISFDEISLIWKYFLHKDIHTYVIVKSSNKKKKSMLGTHIGFEINMLLHGLHNYVCNIITRQIIEGWAFAHSSLVMLNDNNMTVITRSLDRESRWALAQGSVQIVLCTVLPGFIQGAAKWGIYPTILKGRPTLD